MTSVSLINRLALNESRKPEIVEEILGLSLPINTLHDGTAGNVRSVEWQFKMKWICIIKKCNGGSKTRDKIVSLDVQMQIYQYDLIKGAEKRNLYTYSILAQS